MVRCPRRKWPDLGQWPWGVREDERTQGLAIWGGTHPGTALVPMALGAVLGPEQVMRVSHGPAGRGAGQSPDSHLGLEVDVGLGSKVGREFLVEARGESVASVSLEF